ncbi:50S ribosomal protein L18e [Candidatus Micrarchaeota archaeon]|nr:50S ribosomal protein L18e [Candidatus Micrarchaeota archaeon]
MKDNNKLNQLIETLKSKQKGLWKKVAYELNKPRRKRVEVNISKLDVYSKDGSTILVPGKILGSGTTSKKLEVAAFSYSLLAKQLIEAKGGKLHSIEDLLKSNPEGKNVIIIK